MSAAHHPRLLNRPQAADLLGIPLWTLDDLVKRGELPLVKIGKHHRFDPADLIEAGKLAGEKKQKARQAARAANQRQADQLDAARKKTAPSARI